MAARALIIAIEDYPAVSAGGIAKRLPGTLRAGLEFKQWLLDKWQREGRAPADTQLILCTQPAQADGSGASARDIRRALLKLKADGQGSTEELYFYFSGHGFSFVEKPGGRADIVIAADFEDAALSGDACLNLDATIAWLRDHLGTGRHYYFVDACRNKLTSRQIQVGSLLPIDAQASGEASTYVLQSTVDGAVAAADGAFSAALLAGLRGKGRAKVWKPRVNDAMYVRYDSLRGYLVNALAAKQKISHKSEGSDDLDAAVLATLSPVPRITCTIAVEGAPAMLDGELVYRRGRANSPERQALTRQPLELSLEPDDYTLSLRLKNAVAETDSPMPLDLYEAREVVFKRAPGAALESGLESAADALRKLAAPDTEIVVPAGARLTLCNMSTGEEREFAASGRANLAKGHYFATLRTRDGQVFGRHALEVEPGSGALDVAQWRQSPPHVAIASMMPQHAVHDGAIFFSESLGGAVSDPDLDLWLALVGGSRILGPTGDYSKLAAFPLHQFIAEREGASPIYVLAGFEDVETRLSVGVSADADVGWAQATQPAGMHGIREAYFAAAPGAQLVSLQIGDGAPYTIASHAGANRGMLVTLTLDAEDNPRVSQYLLPLGHLVKHMPDEMRDRVISRNHLRDVRFLAQASRAFRQRRDLFKETSGGELSELLDAKWLDPIASTLAAYEALRRGRKDEMREVVVTMRRFFGDIPDTMALARLAGEDIGRPRGVPLFFDGLRAFPDYADWLPLPAGNLDFTSPWTAWRDAVRGSGEAR